MTFARKSTGNGFMLDIPKTRRTVLTGLAALAVGATIAPVSAFAQSPDFARFLADLWPEARAAGVSRATFDMAFAGVAPNPKIIAQTRKQAEFSRPIWEYLDGATGRGRVSRGAAMARQWAATVSESERRFGVPRQTLLGAWGMESDFGASTGKTYAIEALASLAFARHRGDLFRKELVIALKILEGEHISRGNMLGSWAGAMGQTQFLPSSFEKYAVDGDGDGARDIWASVPDALASTANFLHMNGWNPALPWGFEVVLPPDIDFRNFRLDFASWQRLGVRRADGVSLPRAGEAQLLILAGASAPVFLVTDNFEAIRAYNTSDSYALGVGLLGDMVYGSPGIRTPWPRTAPRLSGEERREVQQRLERLGVYKGKHDGNHGWQTRAAIRAYQLKHGLTGDGYADPMLLAHLRSAR